MTRICPKTGKTCESSGCNDVRQVCQSTNITSNMKTPVEEAINKKNMQNLSARDYLLKQEHLKNLKYPEFIDREYVIELMQAYADYCNNNKHKK